MTDTRYCLYARKSTESDETQALSIDSQIKEMLELAKRDNLNVVEIKQEKHSAKEVGQRPIFNEVIKEIREEKFNGILTWAPDRIARNAGDLGTVVDMMDNGKLKEIRTYGQSFGNSPNDKFLLMILGSQAKLENDNKSVNVKRGMKAKCSMGRRPGMAPLGYLTNKEGIKGQRKIFIDDFRAPIVKQMFEKTAFEKYSGRRLYNWLVSINFGTRTGKRVTLSSVYSILKNTFYYGKFEYPVGSGSWYDGLHEPIITKDLFNKVQEQITSHNARSENKEFAFTRLMKCGLCGSGITGEEKHRKLKNGSFNVHVYYGCTRYNDPYCRCRYIKEEDLIKQLSDMIDEIIMDGSEIKQKIEQEIKRYRKFRYGVLGLKESNEKIEEKLDHKKYAKYILSQGTIEEKRELISFLKGRIFIANGKVSINS